MKRKAPMLISLALLVAGVSAYTDITVKSEVAVKAIAPKRYICCAGKRPKRNSTTGLY